VDSPRQEAVNGKTFPLATNDFKAESIAFAFTGDVCLVTVMEKGQAIKFSSGLGKWVTGGEQAPGSPFSLQGWIPKPTKISSHYYWKDADTLVMTLKYVENAHHDILTFTFSDQGLVLNFNNSVSLQREQLDLRAPLEART